MPQLGTEPATQACALTGNRTGDLLLCGMTPNPLSHTHQACTWILDCMGVRAPNPSLFKAPLSCLFFKNKLFYWIILFYYFILLYSQIEGNSLINIITHIKKQNTISVPQIPQLLSPFDEIINRFFYFLEHKKNSYSKVLIWNPNVWFSRGSVFPSVFIGYFLVSGSQQNGVESTESSLYPCPRSAHSLSCSPSTSGSAAVPANEPALTHQLHPTSTAYGWGHSWRRLFWVLTYSVMTCSPL